MLQTVINVRMLYIEEQGISCGNSKATLRLIRKMFKLSDKNR